MSFHKRNGLYCGFIDSNITESYETYPDFFDSYSLLITCLDSAFGPAELPKWMRYLKQTGWDYSVIGKFVWIPSRHVKELFDHGKTFYGFDEIYLLKHYPVGTHLPANRYTTDGYNFAEKTPAAFLKSLRQLGAPRYLSDGCGLNFVCKSRALASRICKGEGK